MIETIQLFTLRGTDIDDVLLNTLGTAIGWLLVNMLYTPVPFERKEKTFARKYPLWASRTGSLVCLSLEVVMTVDFYGCSAKNEPAPETAQPTQAVQFHAAKSTEHSSVSVTASNGILICSDTDEILWEKDSQVPVAPASCAKLLNALTVLEFCDADETFTVGDEINRIAADSSRSYLRKGAQLTVRQAMIAMLLPSGNDAAYALAVYTGRQIASNNDLSTDEALEIFEKEMNVTAKQFGAFDSEFCFPDGYDTDGQYTTAYDLALIGKAALENDLLSEITGMAHSRETWLSGETAEYKNTNEMLLSDNPCYIPDCTGLKTGTTTKAGACLVMSFSVKGTQYIGVIMGSTKEMRFEDGIHLCNMIPNHGKTNLVSKVRGINQQALDKNRKKAVTEVLKILSL